MAIQTEYIRELKVRKYELEIKLLEEQLKEKGVNPYHSDIYQPRTRREYD